MEVKVGSPAIGASLAADLTIEIHLPEEFGGVPVRFSALATLPEDFMFAFLSEGLSVHYLIVDNLIGEKNFS